MSGRMSIQDIANINLNRMLQTEYDDQQTDPGEIINLHRRDKVDFDPAEDPENFTRQKLWTTDYTLELKNQDKDIIKDIDLSEEGKSFLKEMIRYVGAKDYKFGNLNNYLMNDVIKDFKINWVKGMAMLPRSDRRNPIFSIVLRFLQSTLRTEITRAMGPERLDIISRTYFSNQQHMHRYKDDSFIKPQTSGMNLFNRNQNNGE